MLQDPTLMKAVSRILQRSERQDLEKLLDTYVDVGILPQIHNTNNQIIYGRRGTGKTHVLKVLQSELDTSDNVAVVYIDARTLGSTTQFSDPTVSLRQRCTSLFRDILVEIYNGVLQFVVEKAPKGANELLDDLDEFGRVATESITERRVVALSEEHRELRSDTGTLGGKISGTLSVEAKSENKDEGEEKRKVDYQVDHADKVAFPTIKNTLGELFRRADATLYILIDEWSSLPFDIQPFLAEFFKRSFIADPRIVTKIAALEYRSNFGERQGTNIVGFELGSDISTALDIDDYFVYDRSPAAVTSAFADMLFKHIRSELPENYFEGHLKIASGRDLGSRMFTERNVFEELVRGSEGVARDLINIFTTAFFDAQRRGRESIDRKAVVESARQWFEKDKAQNLDDELHELLRRIVSEVIGRRKARSFMIPRELERHSLVQRLFDARVLHLMQRGYADKDNPGNRYNIYSLDYGTYVDLLNTSKQPELGFFEDNNGEEEFVVPFDDKRRIRRIILTEQVLSPSAADAQTKLKM